MRVLFISDVGIWRRIMYVMNYDRSGRILSMSPSEAASAMLKERIFRKSNSLLFWLGLREPKIEKIWHESVGLIRITRFEGKNGKIACFASSILIQQTSSDVAMCIQCSCFLGNMRLREALINRCFNLTTVSVQNAVSAPKI